jgi:CDGSH-type Zn-finger protein
MAVRLRRMLTPPEDADVDTEAAVEIHVRPDGSYKVYGPVRVLDVDGQAYDLGPRRKSDRIGERIKLCRCGASKTMPFCDDSHVEIGFASEPRLGDLE